MQRKVVAILSLGFLLGMGLASCATQSSRTVSSDSPPHFSAATEGTKEKPRDCLTGEERNSEGECVRLHDFDRPFRRGGR